MRTFEYSQLVVSAPEAVRHKPEGVRADSQRGLFAGNPFRPTSLIDAALDALPVPAGLMLPQTMFIEGAFRALPTAMPFHKH
jgi:hypothetical protein